MPHNGFEDFAITRELQGVGGQSMHFCKGLFTGNAKMSTSKSWMQRVKTLILIPAPGQKVSWAESENIFTLGISLST